MRGQHTKRKAKKATERPRAGEGGIGRSDLLAAYRELVESDAGRGILAGVAYCQREATRGEHVRRGEGGMTTADLLAAYGGG